MALTFWPFRCSHPNAWWPRRGADGRDWRYCSDCDQQILSSIQFDLPPPRVLANNPPTGLARMSKQTKIRLFRPAS